MNTYEPQDLSIRGFAPPTFLGSAMQMPSIASHSNLLLNMLSDPIGQKVLHLLQQFQTVQQQETLPFALPDSKELENVIQRTIQDHLPRKKSKFFIHGELKITVDSKDPVTVKINSSSPSASKRKSYTPIRMLQAPSSLPDHVSTNSEALDLSPSGSAHSNESLPVTPVKPDLASVFSNQYANYDAPGKIISFTKRRISVGRRNFPCNQCNKMEFYSLQQLEEHTKVSHGSYRCHICSRTFTQRSNLQRHALKHVGFKPFQCALCLQAYYRKDHLMRHMEVNHPAVNPRENIKVFLSSSKSLEYLSTTQSAVSSPSSLLPVGPEQLKSEETFDRKSSHLC
nr:zinc finger protein [Hymenolepis microstoma]